MKTDYEKELEGTIEIALDCLDRVASTYTSPEVYRTMAKESIGKILGIFKRIVSDEKQTT
mgnify:CR=1 FL=1